MTAPEYAPQNDAEATLVAVWPELAPLLVGRARHKFLTSPWRHEAQERAEEKVQDAFERCLKAARSGAWDGLKPKQFASVVTSNVILDTLRQHKFVAGKLPDADPDGQNPEPWEGEAPSAEAEALSIARASEVTARAGLALELLDRRERRALWLIEWRGAPYREAAAQLGLTLGEFKVVIRAARDHQRGMAALGLPELARETYWRGVRGVAGPEPDPDACWSWLFCLPGNCVPRVQADRGPYRLSRSGQRVGWALLRGPLSPWLYLRMGCGGAACANPRHAVPHWRDGPPRGSTDRSVFGGRYRAAGREADRPAARSDAAPDGLTRGERWTRRREARGLERSAVAREARLSGATAQSLELGRAALPATVAAYEGALSRLEAVTPPLPDLTGTEVRRRREALGLSRMAFCAATGINHVVLEDLEDGRRRGRKAATVRRMAAALADLEARMAPAVASPAEVTRRREALGLTRMAFSRASGVHCNTVRRFEAGTGRTTGTVRRAVTAALDRLEREHAEGSAA